MILNVSMRCFYYLYLLFISHFLAYSTWGLIGANGLLVVIVTYALAYWVSGQLALLSPYFGACATNSVSMSQPTSCAAVYG